MADFGALLAILTAVLIGAASPGPSFIVITRLSVSRSRADGLSAAVGMGLGGTVFSGLALLGLAVVLQQVPWAYLLLKIAGGGYLIYLGIRIWRSAKEPIEVAGDGTSHSSSPLQSFALGLATQLSNPKTAIVYGSIFAALLPASPSVGLLVLLPMLVFLVEFGWYASVALLFSAEKPRAIYLSAKALVDRTAGAVLGMLGGRLLAEGVQSARP